MVTDVVNITKNSEIRVGGFTPYQWVLGRAARIRGSLTDEAEFGQLGVLQHALDPATEFHLRNKLRYDARKCFVYSSRPRTSVSNTIRDWTGPV